MLIYRRTTKKVSVHAHAQGGLVELGQAALAGTECGILLQHAVDLVIHTLEVDYSMILELLPDGSALVPRTGGAWASGLVEQANGSPGTIPLGGYIVLDRDAVAVPDWHHEPRFDQPALLRDLGVRASLCVAIRGHSGPYGVLEAGSREHRPFGDDDVQFLQAIANVLGMAIERRQTEAALRASEARFRRLAENAADIVYRYHFAPNPGFDYVSPAATTITGYAPTDFYADPELVLRMTHPEDRPLLESVTHWPRAGAEPLLVRLIHKEGMLVWTEQRLVPLFDTNGELVGIEGIVRDISERVRAYQTLEQRVEERTHEIERRRQVAEGLREILTILNSNHSVDEILEHVIAQACRLLGTSVGAIYRLNREEGRLTIRAACGLQATDASLSLPLNWGAIGLAMCQRQPVTIPDTATDPWPTTVETNCASGARSGPQYQNSRQHLTACYRALLLVPLIIKDDVYGAIALCYPEPRTFSDEELQLAMAVGDQAALAIENARLVAAVHDKAVQEERLRLARDLHDSVTQALYSITLFAEAATRLLTIGDVVTAADHLRQLQAMGQDALREMRLLIFELRPAVLEQAGLVAALKARLDAVEGRSKMAPTFVVEGENCLPAPVEQALYRIAQEALNNVLRHAQARQVTVTLRQEQPTVVLEVSDDGMGFDPALASMQGGLGLRGIAERVAQLGGELVVRSAPGAGTRLRVEVDL